MESDSTVYINVYDILLTKSNFTSQLGFGLYHTGVEVYGKEYSFAGGQPNKSGIYAIEPKQATRSKGDKLRLHKSIKIGRTQYSQREIDNIIGKLGNEFRTDDYSVTSKNCNNFCEIFCEVICFVINFD
jgi:deubiquitinase DESI2